MSFVQVQLDPHAPTTFEVIFADVGGEDVALERDDLFTLAVEERALSGALASRVAPLPSGAIRVRIDCDSFGRELDAERIGAAVARLL